LPAAYSISFSPNVSKVYEFSFFQGAISAQKSSASIIGETVVAAGSDILIKVTPRDQFNNLLTLDAHLLESAKIAFEFL
jgi:hypothetical protein